MDEGVWYDEMNYCEREGRAKHGRQGVGSHWLYIISKEPFIGLQEHSKALRDKVAVQDI